MRSRPVTVTVQRTSGVCELTAVILHQLLQRVEGDLGRDVEAAVVHVTDPVVLDPFTCVVVQVPYR